jgi:hypothetical protein
MLVITGDGPRIAAALGRVDKFARRLRHGGDARTLDQLRADVATDLLLGGWLPGDPGFARLGTPPAAQVQLVVSLATILGLDQGCAQIPGWGAVSAAQARDLALSAGSIWKRVVTDPLTGRAIETTAGSYKVPQRWPSRSEPATGPAAHRAVRSPPNAATWTTTTAIDDNAPPPF